MAVFTWCHTMVWRIFFSITKNGFFKLCHLTINFRISNKFNKRVTCTKCILVCFSAARKKKSGFYYFAIFSSEQKWRTLLGFPSESQIGKYLLPTPGPMRHLWTLIKRQGRWNSVHWWDVPPSPQFLQTQKKEEQNNRNYCAPSNYLTFRRPRPKFSILPLLM